MTLAAGSRLGPYEILEPIGAGGMGEVYRAKDPRLSREVAIKVLPAVLSADADRLRRFEQEARSASALNHPNIVTIYDIGTQDGTVFIAMELVEGASLRELLIGGDPLPVRKTLELSTQIAEGLARAHAAGIVHRDLKPENLIVSKDGFVKILDFGLAKLAAPPADEASQLQTAAAPETHPGTVMGTVGYMSPEQARGLPLDYRSDQFSFGSGTSGVGLSPSIAAAGRPKTRRLPMFAGVAALVIGTVLGFVARDFRGQPGPPSFKRLTFRRGTVWTARFAPDGQTIVYGAAWENRPLDVFLTRPESPESRPFGLKDGSLLGVSPSGELAVMLGAGTTARSYERFGTLARVPLAGGSPRPILEDVRYADWSPDGRQLMVERGFGGKHRIEFPIGKVLYESPNRLETPRVSPEGNAIAFFEVEAIGEGGARNVAVRVVDLAGKSRTLATLSDWWNLAWSPDGREIWFAAPEAGMPLGISSLQAVSLSGKLRLLLRIPGTLELHDVARDRRVLFSRSTLRGQIDGLFAGATASRDLSWLDRSELTDLSADGKTILFAEIAEGGGPNQSIYLRSTDGSPAILIGEGIPHGLSPDGRWILSTAPTTPPKLVLLPTGAGSPRTLEIEGLTGGASGAFFPDGKSLLLRDNPAGQLPRVFVAPAEGGKPRPLGVAGLSLPPFGNPISPDGRRVIVIDGERKSLLIPAEGGAPSPIAGLADREFPFQWSADGRFLYTHRGGELPAKIWRLEIATGHKELVRELAPSDPAAVTSIEKIHVTPDGKSFVYSYGHNFSDLYVVEGLK